MLRKRALPTPLPLLALGVLALVVGTWVGLARLGWALPGVRPGLLAAHGALMVSGFLGTLIGLERAVALRKPWPFLAPLFTAVGTLLVLFAGDMGRPGSALMTAGALTLLAVFVYIWHLQRSLATGAMALGATSWLVGNLVWLLGRPVPVSVPYWAGFLVLTILGERLELGRLASPPQVARAALAAALGLAVLGLVLVPVVAGPGVRLAGLGGLGLALWLLRYDLARRTVRQRGLPRFMAVGLMLGYAWLGVSGALALAAGPALAGPRYDAVLHAVFLGFAISAVFAHAPVIFPAVLGRAVSFSPVFYGHLALLHLSLALRVVGDLAGWTPARTWGGLLNGVALLLFLLVTVRAVVGSRAH